MQYLSGLIFAMIILNYGYILEVFFISIIDYKYNYNIIVKHFIKPNT